MIRSGNPTLNDQAFLRAPRVAGSDRMTLNGTVSRTIILLGLTTLSAMWIWNQLYVSDPSSPIDQTVFSPAAAGLPMMIGGIGGLIFALITIFKKTWSPFTAPVYALLEGLFLGGISAMMEARFRGIVIQAVGLTFGTLFTLLVAYRSGLIKATENFKLGVFAATGAIALLYLVSFVLSFFGTTIPYIHGSGPIGIGFSLVVVVVAALNLVMDFDFIENACDRGAPRYMEWYAAFGLMVTLVWLYIEILHLLSKLNSRR